MFKKNWKEVNATVVMEVNHGTYFNPLFEYEVEGKLCRSEIFERNKKSKYQPGEKVVLIYNPKRPINARVKKEVK